MVGQWVVAEPIGAAVSSFIPLPMPIAATAGVHNKAEQQGDQRYQ